MKELLAIHEKLSSHYGSQNWWPGEGLEIAIGAVLTQQTNWNNVEKALFKLKEVNCLNLDCLKSIALAKLENLILQS